MTAEPWASSLRVSLSVILLCLALAEPARSAGDTRLSVTVLGNPRDSRVADVREAVAFWNGELERIGAGVRLGPVQILDDSLSDEVLRDLSEGVRYRRSARDLAALIEGVPGNVVIALSGADLMSFGVPWGRSSKGFVALRRADVEPLSLPNVARNAAAHELGHVLGLGHNADPSTLMCGRPAPCRPGTFASETERFFPVTPDEEDELRGLWR